MTNKNGLNSVKKESLNPYQSFQRKQWIKENSMSISERG